MKKILKDTLQSNGKYSRKSITAFASFNLAWIYELILPFCGMNTKEYVFSGLMILCGSTLGLTVWDKKKNNNDTEE